jgi:hypothetical protein
MTIESQAVPALSLVGDTAPPAPVAMLSWQDVNTSELEPFAPDPSIPMGAYAVTTVMLWAQAQGQAGAIPTWEVGSGTWGVILIAPHAALSLIQIPISQMEPFQTNDPAGWGQAVMRWSQANGYQMAIPTYQSDGPTVTALAFGAGYPGITFYDAPNATLFQSLQQARRLGNLADPAVWANAVMRTARAQGFFAGWPTWECTTSRGIMGMQQYDYGALPDPTDANVDRVLKVLNKTISTLQISTADALAMFAGIYATFNEAPIVDPGLQILTDCLFGALEAAANLIPDVGGAVGALISAGMTAAQDAAIGAGGSGPITLETYQAMLKAASDATVSYVATAHDTLLNAIGTPSLPQVWAAPYANPVTHQSMQLGMLATSPDDVVNGDSYWTSMSDQITSALNLNLQVSITGQLYTAIRRTYQNAPATKQWWYGTIASVTAPNGDCAVYIGSAEDELSVWFTDFVQEPGHARGSYVTSTEFWLQASEHSLLPEYPPADLCYALFNGDGFGNTSGYSGAFAKSTVYDNWLMPTQEIGSGWTQNGGGYGQLWSYGSGTDNVVTCTIADYGDDWQVVAGYTDAYGNLTLNTDNSQVQQADAACGFQQLVITNDLAPLN